MIGTAEVLVGIMGIVLAYIACALIKNCASILAGY
jgi:hypothetical protein